MWFCDMTRKLKIDPKTLEAPAEKYLYLSFFIERFKSGYFYEF